MEPDAASSSRGRLHLLVVAADPLARAGLTALLAAEPGLEVVAGTAPEDVAEELDRPDLQVVVWDLGAAPAASVQAAGELDLLAELLSQPADQAPPVLLLLAQEEDQEPEVAVGALAAGARGLLFRDAEPERIAAALVALASGLVVLEEPLAARFVRPPAPSSAAPAPSPVPLAEPLTPRELEVLRLLSEGLSNRRIGERLNISEHTAKFHVNAILGKLGAQSRTDAALRAARLGLVML